MNLISQKFNNPSIPNKITGHSFVMFNYGIVNENKTNYLGILSQSHNIIL